MWSKAKQYLSISRSACRCLSMSEKRVHLDSTEQCMVKGKDWLFFFHNIKNKRSLLDIVITFIKNRNITEISNLPITIANDSETWEVTMSGRKRIFECNHEEADSRMVLHSVIPLSSKILMLLLCQNILMSLSFWCTHTV